MSLLDKLNKFEKEKGDSGVKSEIKIAPENQIKPRKLKKQIKSKVCPLCNKKHRISGEKTMNKDEVITWFKNYININKDNLPLGWLRGQKLTFESVNEMRK